MKAEITRLIRTDLRRSFVGLGLLAMLIACSAPAGGEDDSPDSRPPEHEDSICETRGYPCTLSEVPDAVLARSDALLSEAQARVESGDTYAQVQAWIEAQEGVAEAVADAEGLYFRAEGGVPTWLVEPARRETPQSLAISSLAPEDVVGRDTPRDADAPNKNAIVIAPFTWQWPTREPANQIEVLLQGIHDYQGRVQKKQNTVMPPIPADDESSTGGVNVDDFRGWHAYDVVYVSSHGGRRNTEGDGCEEFFGIPLEWCLISVTSGERVRSSVAAKALYGDNPGIRTTRLRGVEGIYLTLTADFFKDEYGLGATSPGLDEAVVFIDTCNSYYNSTLATNLAGSSSAYFGWAGSVTCSFSATVTPTLFNHLAAGYTARAAFAKIKSDGVDPPGGVELELNSHGDDLRIFELPSLKVPGTPTARLEDGALLRIRGTPADGAADALELVVDVTGIIDPDDIGGGIGTSQADDPAELYNLTFLVDDREVGASNLAKPPEDRAEVVQLDDLTRRLTYVANLPFDLPQDGEDITLKVEVMLPEGGTSAHEVEVSLVGTVCEFQAVLSGYRNENITARTVKLTEQADLELFGTADAYVDDEGALTHIEFEGPLLGRTFSGGFGGESPAVPGSRLPSVPAGSTGSFDVNAYASVGPSDDPDGGYTVANLAPVFYDPAWQPLTLTISEFTDDYVIGRISGEVRDLEDESGPEPRSSFIDISFQARTTDAGSGSRCIAP